MNSGHQTSRSQRQSQTRQRIASCYQSLGQILQWFGGREPLLKGSAYLRRRRCGKGGCRCAQGRLHQDKVLAIRRQGRIQIQSVKSGNGPGRLEAIRRWRQFQENRREFLKTMNQLLSAVDRLGQMRQNCP